MSTVRPSSLVASLQRGLRHAAQATLDRRSYLKRVGLLGAGALAAGELPLRAIEPAQAQPAKPAADAEPQLKRTICSHCSVGCSVDAIVQNGVWVRQDTAFD